MDQVNPERPVPGWFTIAAIGAVAWMLLGCVNYLMWVTADPATLPRDLLSIVNATPPWVIAAFAIAVWVGLSGAILLVLRRRLAVPFLLISLVAIVIQNSAWLIVPELRGLVGSDDLLLPFIITVVCYVIWHFAWASRRAGWLR